MIITLNQALDVSPRYSVMEADSTQIAEKQKQSGCLNKQYCISQVYHGSFLYFQLFQEGAFLQFKNKTIVLFSLSHHKLDNIGGVIGKQYQLKLQQLKDIGTKRQLQNNNAQNPNTKKAPPNPKTPTLKLQTQKSVAFHTLAF